MNIPEIVIQVVKSPNQTSNWETFLSFFTSFLGVGIPLLLYYFSTKKERKKEQRIKVENHLNSLKHFAVLIENVLAISNRQAESCRKVKEQIDSNSNLFPDIDRIVATDIKRVVNLSNHNDIFHSYIGKFGNSSDSITRFRKIFCYLDYVDKLYDRQISDYDKYNSEFMRKLKLYKSISERLMDKIASLLNSIKQKDENYSENEYWSFLNDLILNYYSANSSEEINKTYDYDYKMFILPLKEGLIKNHRQVVEYEPILIEAKKASYIYSDLISIIIEVGESYNDVSLQFSKAHSILYAEAKDLIAINHS